MPERICVSLIIVVLFCGAAVSSESQIAVVPGANFYGQEEWEPGKLRRWMWNDGKLDIRNDGSSRSVDLRFLAESFRIARTLQIRIGDRSLLEVAIPPSASLFVAVKNVPLASGESMIVLSAVPGPDQVSRYLKSADERELSIAFGPFSVIDARSPAAQREETAAFPQADRAFPGLSAEERAGGNLRREGRLLEAWDAYRAALASSSIHPTTYLLAGLTLMALDRPDEARPLFARGTHVEGFGIVASSARDACSRLLDYLGHSALLAGHPADPGKEFRQHGEIYRAVALYRSTLAHDPQNLSASYWLGLLSALAERPREALPLLDVVAKRSPAGGADATMARWLEQYLGSR